ncbi:hypothetical protein K2173_013579 [Erythroxylum novogranatense]|uniref:Protein DETOXIFICATION n=1 Tax=Erythroxylum novogranatense TaxID=1862640 RepID=A0AAV8TJQ8_9ROSI|nr:hypothetical protein K2173_013579 [Erythroxylum novogranatense]
MEVETLAHSSFVSVQSVYSRFRSQPSVVFKKPPIVSLAPRVYGSRLRLLSPGNRRGRFLWKCVGRSENWVEGSESESLLASVSSLDEEEGEEATETEVKRNGLENRSIWDQIKEIVIFTGPATGLWLCGPLMSLIDTAVIGQCSSIELAALGPGTVLCDYISYVFMFLSVATSNMVATSLARVDKSEVQHQISILLFVGFSCGITMFIFTKFFGSWALTAFTGSKNAEIVSAANTYVQIRGFAWPAVLVGWVAQSASLGMKDSWGPLKALAVASVVNGVGDILLCSYLGYGIAGAAWATMASQVIAGWMMIEALNKKGYNAFAFSVPTPKELLSIVWLAAPVFVTMMSKVAFYVLLVYFSTSMGTHSLAAHQVMLQTYGMCSVCGEPLSQTAQSFMPELMYGVRGSLKQARMLLKSLVIIGSIVGLVLGIFGTSVPWLFPNIFTPDQKVIQEMHKVLLPFFMGLTVTSINHSLEGTLMAGRDLKFLSFSMIGCFLLGSLILVFASSRGYGFSWCWFALAAFQWARFFSAIQRLLSRDGILYSEDLRRQKIEQLEAA